MRALADEEAGIRGIGPSSSAAIERYRHDGSLVAPSGDTNGALMRAPVLGWAARDPDDRRALVRATTVTTHGGPPALACAQVIAALADLALAGAPLDDALAEVDDSLRREIDDWSPSDDGVSMDSAETTAAVLAVIRGSSAPAEAAALAVRIGGDTDTVAAISAGILASHPEHADAPIEWLDQVLLPPAADIERIAAQLAARRGR